MILEHQDAIAPEGACHDSESAADNDLAEMRAQWDRMAMGWSDAGTVIRPWLHKATQAMLGMAGVTAGSHVLDVAAGAGDQTLDIAERVGPHGYVLATDLSPAILQFAAEQAAAAGHRNVEARVSDGQKLQIEDSRFDVVVCRLGLMFSAIRCRACAKWCACSNPAAPSARWCSGRRRLILAWQR